MSALLVPQRNIAWVFAFAGADGVEELVFHQLEIARLAAEQCEKLIVEPE